MNYNFDLDIHNYKIDDLMTFLSLPKNYSVFDLNNNVKTKTVEITSLTDIDDEYKYNILNFIGQAKKLLSYKFIKDDNNIDFCLSFPKKLKHIYFDGSNYHGSINISNDVSKMGKRYTLMFNIWNSKPSDIKYYNSTRINENKYNKIDNIFNFVEHDKKIYNINSKNITNEFYKMLFIKRVNINFFINNFFKSNNIILKDELNSAEKSFCNIKSF